MSKTKQPSDTEALGDRDVIIRQMVWLPAAGLPFCEPPSALRELAELLPGGENKADLAIVKALPELERFTNEEFVDLHELCDALSNLEGFIIQMETPKRRWFSDGTERINWGDTWSEWAYAPDQASLRKILEAWVDLVEERDSRQFARVLEVEFVGGE